MPLINSALGKNADPDLVVWRYMSLDKFQSLLKERALFFCRADKFSDAFEASIPTREADYRPKEYKKMVKIYGLEDDPEKEKKYLNDIALTHKERRKRFLVNCWHINNSENDSMWRLYMDNSDGVAIRTTVSELIKAFENTSEEIEVGMIRYINYKNDIWYDKDEFPVTSYNLNVPIWHKRIEFIQEAELRLIHTLNLTHSEMDGFWENSPNQNGKFFNLNIASMALTIHTHPSSGDDHLSIIKSLVQNSGLNFPTLNSSLSSEVIF